MRVGVVLVRPRYAGNVGAAVRVAANFGADEVVLVKPACFLDDPEFIRMAMGGERLVAVRTTATLVEAVGAVPLVVATTSSRDRDPRGIHTPGQLRRLLHENVPERIAVVFGSERGGLKRDELRAGHLVLAVPTNPAFPVLNVAQAVAVVLASLAEEHFALDAPVEPMDRPAPAGELAAAVAHLEEVLLRSGYLDPANPRRVTDQFRRWLGRTVPTRRELALLHALAAHIAYLLARGASTQRSGASDPGSGKGKEPA